MPITPEELKKLRSRLGLTQEEAAKVVHVSKRTWVSWEIKQGLENNRKMPEGLIELFCLKKNIKYKTLDNKIHLV